MLWLIHLIVDYSLFDSSEMSCYFYFSQNHNIMETNLEYIRRSKVLDEKIDCDILDRKFGSNLLWKSYIPAFCQKIAHLDWTHNGSDNNLTVAIDTDPIHSLLTFSLP